MQKTKFWVSALVALVVIIAAGVYLVKHNKTSPKANNSTTGVNQTDTTGKTAPAGLQPPQKTEAAAGKIITGFPTEIAFSPSKVEESYFVTSDLGKQYTVHYTSLKSNDEIYKAFTDYFSANKYTVVNAKKDTNPQTLYAYTVNGDINVTILKSGTGSDVNVTYLDRQRK